MDWILEPWGAGLIVFLAGMLLMTELLVKAKGLAGLSGTLLLVLYIYSRSLDVDPWSVGLLVIGLILFIMDGKLIQDGTLAAIGLLAKLVGLVLPTGDFLTGSLVAVMWILGLLIGFFSLKVLPHRDLWNNIILKNALTRETGYSSVNARYRELIGKKGTALTDFRPSGTLEIDGVRYSGISQGVWMEKGTSVQVVSVDGTRILVQPLSMADKSPTQGE
ncbi:NfeD family protein [Melghirimyces algeriensis]|uniref:NfeD-like C-terminal, partner-binding n=1 Tax=Melghirimyces algeriensis TaxID=910412 RepID=A0A521AL64_9BACL|nr:NfeD family protein [Melghirimyces algeriensis]SMO35548.1 NfeD-like C-terminal, partner-binding [Melghirimyces algeriensis]